MKKLLLSLLICMLVMPAQAQFWNRLGDAARNAAENAAIHQTERVTESAIDRTVEGAENAAVDATTDAINESKNKRNTRAEATQPQPQSGWTCPQCGAKGQTGKFCTECGANLPMMAQDEDWRWSQTIPTSSALYYTPGMFPDIPAAYSTPQSISALMVAMPTMPTLENIYCAEAKEKALRATYIPFQKSLDEALLLNSERSQELDRQIKTVGNKQQKTNQRAMAQYQSNVNAGLMPSQEEMMALYMSGEIRENMSEAQMMDVMAGHFAQKWGVSKQEYLKIINLAQKNEKQAATYIQSNHPDLYNRLYAANAQYGNENVHADDPREGELDRIGDQLSELQDQLNEVLGVYKGMGTSEYRKFDDMRDQMDADWKTCPEAKQIDIIEQALEERVEAWYSTVTIKGDVPYPAWWTAERKKINGLVDQWNRRWAVKWLKMATSGDSQIRPIMTRAAELEVENEKLGKQGSQENFKYLMNKKLCCSIFAYMMHVIQPINDAFNFPCREHVEETGYIIVEK